MKRKHFTEEQKILLSLEKQMKEDLEDIAKADDLPVNALIRKYLKTCIKNNKMERPQIFKKHDEEIKAKEEPKEPKREPQQEPQEEADKEINFESLIKELEEKQEQHTTKEFSHVDMLKNRQILGDAETIINSGKATEPQKNLLIQLKSEPKLIIKNYDEVKKYEDELFKHFSKITKEEISKLLELIVINSESHKKIDEIKKGHEEEKKDTEPQTGAADETKNYINDLIKKALDTLKQHGSEKTKKAIQNIKVFKIKDPAAIEKDIARINENPNSENAQQTLIGHLKGTAN